MTIVVVASSLWTTTVRAGTVDILVFNDRQHYSSVLLQQGRVQLDADWNEEPPGTVKLGQEFGRFHIFFNPNSVVPVVAPGIAGGLAVGATPDGTLGGDQGITLVVTPGLAVTAFGAEIVYPAFNGQVGADVFRLLVECPVQPCLFAGNLANLDSRGGTLFLGVVAAPGFALDRLTLEAVTPRDSSGEPIGFVPDWQIASITFAPVTQPSTLLLIVLGFGGLVAARHLGSGLRNALPLKLADKVWGGR